MPREAVIYHNTRCSNSCGALTILRERGVPHQVVEYLKAPLDAAGLTALMELLESPPHDMVRVKEAAYHEAGLSGQSSPEDLIEAMVAHPSLMQRPIVVQGERATIARPPEMLKGWLRD